MNQPQLRSFKRQRPLAQPAPRMPHSVITALPSPASRRSVAASVGGVVLYLVALLVTAVILYTQMAMMSYATQADRVKINRITEQNQSLRQQINQAKSPLKLAQVAHDAGMVPAAEVGYITLRDNRVEGGAPAPVPPPPPAPVPEPTPTPAAVSPAAAPERQKPSTAANRSATKPQAAPKSAGRNAKQVQTKPGAAAKESAKSAHTPSGRH